MTEEINNPVAACAFCDEPLTGPYCAGCGHKVLKDTYSVGYLIKEWIHKFTKDQVLFLRTIWHLVIKPEAVINPYLQHRGSAYYHPISFFLISISLVTLLAYFFNQPDPERMLQNQQELYRQFGLEMNEGGKNFQMSYIIWVQEHLNWIYSSALPFLALTFLLIFKKRGYNYGQYLIFSSYTFGLVNLFNVPRVLIHDPLDVQAIDFVYSIVGWVIYFTWVFRRVFEKKWMPALGLAVWSYVLYSVLFIVSIIILTFVGVMLFVAGVKIWKGIF